MSDAENMQAMLEAKWDAAFDPDADGICNVCSLPAEMHPCPEHRAAALAKEAQEFADRNGLVWNMPSRIEPGQF